MDKSTGPPTRPQSSQCTALVLILMLEEIWSSVVMGSEERCWLCNYTYYRYQPTSRKGWTASSLLIGFNKVKLLVSISHRNTNSARLSFPTLVNVKPQINTGLWSVSKPNLSVSIPIKGLIALQMHLIFEAKMKKTKKQQLWDRFLLAFWTMASDTMNACIMCSGDRASWCLAHRWWVTL